MSLGSQANLHQWHRDDPCTYLAAPHCLVRFTCGRAGSQTQPQTQDPRTSPVTPPAWSHSWTSWQPLQQARGLLMQEGQGPCWALSGKGYNVGVTRSQWRQGRIKTSLLIHAVNNGGLAKPGKWGLCVPLIHTGGGSAIILPSGLSTAHFHAALDTMPDWGSWQSLHKLSLQHRSVRWAHCWSQGHCPENLWMSLDCSRLQAPFSSQSSTTSTHQASQADSCARTELQSLATGERMQ